MRMLSALARDRRGVSAVEFAIVSPVLILFLIGLLQVGMLFNANAGLEHAVQEGARFATTYPAPADADITKRMTDSRFGLDSTLITGPTITRGEAGTEKVKYVEITMSYAPRLDFVFFEGPKVTLSDTRRAYYP